MEENEIINDAKQFVDEIVKETTQTEKNPQIDNALNAVSVAALFDLFALSKSASFYVLLKMHDFPSFNAFLGAAFDESLENFIPELAKPKDNEKA